MAVKKVNVAVVGATGAVGATMRRVLEERDFPVARLHLLASARSAGAALDFRGRKVAVADLEAFDFAGVDIALFSAGAAVSERHAPRAAAAGCVVVDNTSHFRRDDDIPLVVPEVNPEALAHYANRGIVANPNCSTIQMVVALKPLHDRFRITRINVATYQAVSGAGRRAVEEMLAQTRALLDGKPATGDMYPKRIAFNALPQIDVFLDNGYTREEMKMVWETRKIFGDDAIRVNPTTVRVPVVHGHSEAVHIECERDVDLGEARAALASAAGVTLMDERRDGGYPTAATDADGSDDVFVGRLRKDISHPRGLDLWVVSDNLRKGAATNSVQIAEHLLREHLAAGHCA
ncbi:MAG: aspartate-semialdehyde dehydrogenase [Gammaproteobacteria bacterium]|nr:aspartate-semialdehyde dehydrogenase [Gammaproteobacteria bacterium]